MIGELARKDFKLVDKNDEISKVFGYFYGESDFPIVMDGKKPWGIIDERRLIKTKLSKKEKIKDFVVGVPKLDATYSIEKAKQKMVKSGIDTIIVTSEKDILGYVNAIDLIKKIGVEGKAETFMRYIEPIDENESIGNAINQMKKANERILPILTGKKFYGILGIKNILRIITTHKKTTDYHQERTTLLDAPVKGYAEPAVTNNPNDDLKDIIDVLEEQGFAVICKNKEYLGIIEPMDLLVR